MTTWWHAWLELGRQELRRLLRSRATWLAFVGLLASGVAAVQHGSVRLAREQRAAAAAEPELAEQVEHLRQLTAPDDDLGLFLYYLTVPLSSELEPWSGTAAGLEGVHPAAGELRLTGLVPQLYQTELGNPTAQHAGHFDLAFVLALLVPLVLIGLSHDVHSRDEDLGVQWLVRSQPLRTSRLIGLRVGLRAGLVGGTASCLLALAALALGLPLDARLGAAAAALLAYVGVWALAVFLVISASRPTPWNAMALIGAWIAACVLVPGLAQVTTLALQPHSAGIELTLEQRMNMNARWDQPKALTMAPFFERRPEWSGTPVPQERFSWPWYYAMHELGDQHVWPQVAEYQAALEQRASWTERLALVLPPLALELLLQKLAGTDLRTALERRTSIVRHHERLKLAVYPWIYGGQGLSAFRLEALPRHHFSRAGAAPPWALVAGLLAQLALLVALLPAGIRRLDRAERQRSANPGQLALAR